MPLTLRQNGTTVGGQPNNAQASWWNDFHDLLTGVMTDQPITLANSITNITSGPNINSGTVAAPFTWHGTSGTAFFGILDIKPTDAGGKHWLIGYNGGDQHLQIQQVTDGIDVIDIDISGNVYFSKDIHITGSYWGAVQIDTEGGNAVIRTQPTSNPLIIQVNGKNTSFNTDGSISVTYPSGVTGVLGCLSSAGGGAAGHTIWVGTSDPATFAVEGDIWIKA